MRGTFRARLAFMLRRALSISALLLASGCSGASGSMSPVDSANAETVQRLLGYWRLQSYVPDSTLSPALLLSMKGDAIMVRVEQGRIVSASDALTFDRTFRIKDAAGERFKMFIADEVGVEVENQCEFDVAGNIAFRTVTPPWTGQGVLAREGSPLRQAP